MDMLREQTPFLTGLAVGALGAALLLSSGRRRAGPLSGEPRGPTAVETGVGIPHPASRNSMFNGCIYLDYNATTPIYPEVSEKMWPYATQYFGNPSSAHVFGGPCKASLGEARSEVAKLINANTGTAGGDRVIFTSCGSESDNRAVDIALELFRERQLKSSNNALLVPHVITSAIEHPAVLVYLKKLLNQGVIHLDIVGVDTAGCVPLDEIKLKLCASTALVTIMHSNNEIGTIQPIQHIVAAAKRYNSDIIVHTDAAQSLGKTLVDAQALGVDLMTIVGHKFGAPKGVAALYVKRGVNVTSPLLAGGGQEGGLRAGTENMLLIVALGEAARIARTELGTVIKHFIHLRIILLRAIFDINDKLMASSGDSESCVRFNGPPQLYDMEVLRRCLDNGAQGLALSEVCLLNTISVSFKNQSGHVLVAQLGSNEIACSAGSACHAVAEGSRHEPVVSDVLQACGVPREFGLGTLRISTGRHTSVVEVELAAERLKQRLIGMI